MRKLCTAESVTEGHPDKICDQISDAILDNLLAQDSASRVACETMATQGMVLIAGEISSRAKVDYAGIARKVIRGIGYKSTDDCFDGNTCAVVTSIHQQSPDIAMGVDDEDNLYFTGVRGAGDQGMMFGYACDETPEMLPLPIVLAHRLTRRLASVRKDGVFPWLKPDGKAQVTVVYEDGKPKEIKTVVLSAQHLDSVPTETVRHKLLEHVVRKALPGQMLTDNTEYFINPTGRFVLGGPAADCGLTGRKIIVDTYGGFAPHGGGCFSGKDPTKVDRSAAYMARYIAKNIVAADLASKCTVQLAYSIGVAEPVGLYVDTHGTGQVTDDTLQGAVSALFNMTPNGIIRRLDLRRPIYLPTSCYGHFGRPDLPWERIDAAEALIREVM